MANIVPTRARSETYARVEENIIEDVLALKPEPNRDVLLVLGDAGCVWDDYTRFMEFGVPHDTMCINHSALAFLQWGRPFEHYIAGDSHRNDMRHVAKLLPETTLKHCWNPGCGEENGFDIRWVKQDHRGWSGTTATLGIKIGITLDYLRIVLAGCPMDKSGHWYDDYLPDDDPKRSSIHQHHMWYWTELASRPLGHFIRSMSGNTKDLFGEPTYEWLTEVIGNG